ncbi:MAG TPA: hypothetical protein DDW58_03375 [Clostridiaceae bacterium]|jgi:hypothetical protein|nr:hypothetical protein [Clostridiaceae bacterium]HBG38278.1 hypothetical protein [Clostridiaceae bacterium]HBN28797.1 hypothetical protein [Clostridiaceae bacterium]
MRNLQNEAEAIQISIYCEIIMQMLKKHKELSVIKMLVFSYLIKGQKFIPNSIYTANTSQDLIYKGLSLLAGDYIGLCDSIGYIIKAIHLLIQKNLINLENNIIIEIPNEELGKSAYEESLFLEKVIEASKRMSDKQFMREVMYNV